MKLLRKPVRPRWSPILALAFSPTRPPEWEPFLSSLPGARELAALWHPAIAAEIALDEDSEADELSALGQRRTAPRAASAG